MKIEYIAEGSVDCPLIRLYDFTPNEANELLAAIAVLAAGAAKHVVLARLTWMEPIGGCRLTFCVRSWDQGAIRLRDPAEFECGFTPATWDNIAALVAPFAAGSDGFQWLAGTPGEASVLMSRSGQW